MERRIYLDHSATTPADPRVVEAMLPYFTEISGNASSIHYFGQRAREAVDRSRHEVAGLINARPNEIIFTSGGTESNNLAIRGLMQSNQKYGNHIVTTQIEHPSVLNVCQDLEKRGYTATYVPVNEGGIVDLEHILNAITENTVLVSVMAANNEIGTIQPIGEIARKVAELKSTGKKIWLHTDAVQAAGKIPMDVEEIQCDLMTISAHKIYAPKGVGALYVRRGVRLHPQNLGGHQERERRGGTEPVPLIVGFGKASELAQADIAEGLSELKDLRDKFESEVGEIIPGVTFNGDRERRLPNISNISFAGVEGEALLINLDMQGIAVSTGAACSSGTLEPSPVIRALGADDERARSAIRFSFGRANTAEELERLLQVLPSAVENIRSLTSVRRG